MSQKKPDIPPAGDKIIQVQMLLMAIAVFSSWFEQGLIACCFFGVAKKFLGWVCLWSELLKI